MTAHRNPQLSEALAGFRDVAPLAIGVAVYGAAFGLLAAQAGLNGAQTGLMGASVFAGASQFLAVERLEAGAGAIAALIAGVIINLRLLLMTASLRDELSARPWWQIFLAVHLTTDESWALLHSTRAKGKDVGYWYLVGGGVHILGAWLASTVAGVYFAGLLPAPEALGLDFAFTAAFIAVLVSLFQTTRDLPPWCLAAGVAAALSFALPQASSAAMIIGGLSGALFAALGAARHQRQDP